MARITRAHIEKRLDQLARREGLCPLHMTRLECPYNRWWVGSAAEWEELELLIHAIEPYQTRLQLSGQLCPHCRAAPQLLFCLSCNLQAIQPYFIPDEIMSPPQYDRYCELSKRLEVKPPGTAHDLLCPDESFLKPPVFATPEPVTPSPPSNDFKLYINKNDVQLEKPVVPIRMPPPAPAPVDDDEEEADDDLVRMVEELKQRLAR